MIGWFSSFLCIRSLSLLNTSIDKAHTIPSPNIGVDVCQLNGDGLVTLTTQAMYLKVS